MFVSSDNTDVHQDSDSMTVEVVTPKTVPLA